MKSPTAKQNGNPAPRAFVFNKDQIRDGYEEEINGRRRPRINGLLRDWVSWQNSPEKHPFEIFKKVLARLSPPSVGDLGALLPGEPTRIPDDSREIPTLAHPYGIVPFIYASAGVQRIVSLAYLLVWAWHEHKINSAVSRREPERRMVILVDEIEAHLHPQWQRSILPALLEVSQDLDAELQAQLVVATHSPLVMASVEPYFDAATDKLFLLDVDHELLGSEVNIKEIDFLKEGLVSSWLTSDVFGLEQARSLEGERAVEDARRLQRMDSPPSEAIKEVSERLKRYLPEIEGFWPRWMIFADKHGVEL